MIATKEKQTLRKSADSKHPAVQIKYSFQSTGPLSTKDENTWQADARRRTQDVVQDSASTTFCLLSSFLVCLHGTAVLLARCRLLRIEGNNSFFVA